MAHTLFTRHGRTGTLISDRATYRVKLEGFYVGGRSRKMQGLYPGKDEAEAVRLAQAQFERRNGKPPNGWHVESKKVSDTWREYD